MNTSLSIPLLFAFLLLSAQAGPVPANDPSIMAWATGYQELIRGPNDISNPGNGNADFGNPADLIGPSGANGAEQPVVSLGDGGSVVLTFANPITNKTGDDFAVFENGNAGYLELAFVEVSSDGNTFFRFDAVSLTQTDTQIGAFGTMDADNLTNLAGKYEFGMGTGFDLQELSGQAGLNPNAITHVKIIDVVGSLDPAYGTRDSQNNLINDPWTTDFSGGVEGFVGTGGFDLDAVGVIHSIPEPSFFLLCSLGLGLLLRYASFKRH